LSLGCADEAPPAEVAPRPVRTLVVQQASDSVPALLAGVARAGIESNLSFRVAGTIVELPVIVGQRVERGRILGRLDPVDYELAVEEARASVAQAEAGLRQAMADYGRLRALYENQNAALSDLEAARAQFESAEAQVEASRKRVEQGLLQVGYTVLRAPIGGVVAAVEVEINETVPSGQTVIRLTSGDRPEVEVAVSEVTIPLVRAGSTASLRFDALPDREFAGTITEVGVAPSPGSSTYPVVVVVNENGAEIRSGMSAEVTLQLATPEGERPLLLPPIAVGEDESGRYVFVVREAGEGLGQVSRRPVSVGRLTPAGLEISEGLAIGDVVVTAGVRRLSDGMQVRYSADADTPWM
jgi:RND family efflux transporter MFP subunit